MKHLFVDEFVDSQAEPRAWIHNRAEDVGPCMGFGVLRLTLIERVAASAVCFAVGAALLFAVGFAHSTILHNAAHDVRHSFVFPCH